MEMTTARLSREAVDFMKAEGKYSESLADIADRLFAELKACREEQSGSGTSAKKARATIPKRS